MEIGKGEKFIDREEGDTSEQKGLDEGKNFEHFVKDKLTEVAEADDKLPTEEEKE